MLSGGDRAADPWVQSISATCDCGTLRIVNYGAGSEAAPPEVTLNDHQPSGLAIDRLERDLARGGANYRFEILCGSGGSILVRLHVGESGRDGVVRFEIGEAVFADGALRSYTGLGASDETTFWFR